MQGQTDQADDIQAEGWSAPYKLLRDPPPRSIPKSELKLRRLGLPPTDDQRLV